MARLISGTCILASENWPLSIEALSNQIRVVAFNVPQLTQASFLQKKNQTLENVCRIAFALDFMILLI